MKVPSMIAAELRRLTASPMAAIALVALMCVPILYGGLYLWANQDPYGRFPDVPVALVVEDAGTDPSTGSGSGAEASAPENYGQKVADNLLEDGAFDWRVMTAAEAEQALKDGTVDFTVTLPADFSAALASAGGDQPHQALIELETNDANNYLASTIGSQTVERIRRSVAEMVGSEAAERLLTGLSDVRGKLSEAADGATQLFDGAGTAHDGSATLASGLATLADGTGTLADGAQRLADGAAQVRDGNAQLADAAGRAASLAQQATDALPTARGDLAQAMAEQGLTPEQIDTVLSRLDPVADRLREGNTAAQEAAGKVEQLAEGARSVADGARQLADGARSAADGAASARDGAGTLRDGLDTLGEGIGTLRDGLAQGVDAIPASTPELRAAQADTIADPVSVSSDKVAAAKDYGQGLAPFFAALAGWIGIYALFLIVKPISHRAVTALHSPVRITLAGWLTPAGLGALQMVGLLAVLGFALGFDFQHPGGSLGVMVMASATYAAIILALNVWLGSVGQFMGLVLMVLQLVTAGGTFPWQTLPAPLSTLHHVLPMGYVVDAMRQLMYGGDLHRALWDLGVLGVWLVGALVIAAIGVTRMTHRRTLRDLQPSLIG
ncbi:YhgE/Pip domain-containing protein [Microbacterium sp. EF45047]|uniref:YhgE/Pip domain-containing protein n=1 Tax=Microbacterium sp. EF45047 TaxID=2809708 RepID=UPI00234AB341|nr:YhgE/Pip domain-containing protein [Microbacterium sp. EF45047]WCM55747.1 YhgE/Pip domain-containing protein [Microbacterium sp. EF45047]